MAKIGKNSSSVHTNFEHFKRSKLPLKVEYLRVSRTKIRKKLVSHARAVLRAQVRFLIGFSLILQQTTFVVTYDRFDWV